jgi:hypothetical protein
MRLFVVANKAVPLFGNMAFHAAKPGTFKLKRAIDGEHVDVCNITIGLSSKNAVSTLGGVPPTS